jgi:hypothetical protein
MFFAITALVVSAVQIAIGIAIGHSLRKHRQRQETVDDDGSCDAPRIQRATAETHRHSQREAASNVTHEAKTMGRRLPHRQSADEPDSADAVPAFAQPAAASMALAAVPAKSVAESASKPATTNRRQSPRRPFEFRQQVAPYHGGALPGKASFREVECQDISSTGFSFLSSQLPDFDSIVVSLGVAPQQVYLWGQIVSRSSLDDGPAPLYRIGCRFVGLVNQ